MFAHRTLQQHRPNPSRIRSRNTPTQDSSDTPVANKRSKSRSPSRIARSDPFGTLNASMTMAKISTGNRTSKSTTSSGSVRQSTSSNDTDMLSDAGQRMTSTVSLHKASSSRSSTPATVAPHLHNQQKKDKGKDRQSKPNGSEMSGPLAVAEFERMKKEIELLKSNLGEQKKAFKKQAKKIEELKAEVMSSRATRVEQEAQFQLLKSKHSRKTELLNTIESSLTCHICMDLLNKPFSLSPCGHTFCLRDLQDWFRKAPPTDEDMDLDTEDPEYIKFRPKHCPACRVTIIGRPLPVFLVRDIVSVLQGDKASGDAAGTTSIRRSNSPYVSEDPWEGLFPNDSELEEAEAEDVEEERGMLGFGIIYSDSDSEMEIESDYDSNGERIEGEEEEDEGSVVDEEEDEEIESGEEEEAENYSEEEVESYVEPQWEPPMYDSSDGLLNVGPGYQPQLLRRGCPTWLSTTYRVRYTHNDGLIAHLNSLEPQDVGVPLHGHSSRMHRLFLGWNINNEDDILSEDSGRLFMTKTLEELASNPQKFSVRARPSGFMDIHVLVLADQVNQYDTTDSEIWI